MPNFEFLFEIIFVYIYVEFFCISQSQKTDLIQLPDFFSNTKQSKDHHFTKCLVIKPKMLFLLSERVLRHQVKSTICDGRNNRCDHFLGLFVGLNNPQIKTCLNNALQTPVRIASPVHLVSLIYESIPLIYFFQHTQNSPLFL